MDLVMVPFKMDFIQLNWLISTCVCYDISSGWSRGKASSVKSSFSRKIISTANNQKDSPLSQRDSCPNEIIKSLNNDYMWITGENLYQIIEMYKIQFVWGVFSGFDKDISFERIMEYELPKSEGYNHSENKLDTQNPLAKVELVADDSTCLFFKSKIDIYTKKFKEYFPLSYEEL
jgi:hypothetical protein